MTITLNAPTPADLVGEKPAAWCAHCGWLLSGLSHYARHLAPSPVAPLPRERPCDDPMPAECDHDHRPHGPLPAMPTEGCPTGEVERCCGECH